MNAESSRGTAVVTGASSGIGAASAVELAKAGFHIAMGARRVERLHDVAQTIEEISGKRPFVAELDVTSTESCTAFVNQVTAHCDVVRILLNNAGLASGSTRVLDAKDDAEWQVMIDTNVSGLFRMTRLLLPKILESGDGHIINLGSIAGREAYAGGSVYCATKFAVRAFTEALRQELLGKPVRVTTIDPGMVETEFSMVRFHGDVERANRVYQGMTPLSAQDIAECVAFAATRPSHVNIDAVIVTARDQAGVGKVSRKS